MAEHDSDETRGQDAAPAAGDGAMTVDAGSALLREAPGSVLGRYKLLELLGEGGFGSVFLAEQHEPVRRRVAIKIIKLGMDTRQVIARFDAERQALAMMDHPNIAKVLDAGATDSGRPYFVMELVKGISITEYCDTHNLSTDDRLRLFVQVCQAVQHAHQKGIIHRDLKPSNVLVTMQDGAPAPKVIDFGIAKATSGRLSEQTVFTQHQQMIGTPQYMSPEQAEMSGLDIDTRSDIYSLGVLLYELLTGTTPFDAILLQTAGYGEMQKIIRETEPPRPSTRVSSLGETLAATANHRGIEPRKLCAKLRGDLDWIVMRAMEKDRTRRYETAQGLAADVLRHLAGEAVLAAPPSRVYRMQKFLRRNKAGAIAAGLVTTALLLGVIGTSAGLINAQHQRKLAEQAAAQERLQRAEAEGQRRKAELVNQFLKKALQSSDPNQGGQQGMLVSEVMLAAVKDLDAGLFKDQPEIEAGLRLTIAEILEGNGRLREALPLAQRSLNLYRGIHSGDDPDVARSLDTLAMVQHALGGGLDDLQLARESLAMRRRLYPGGHRDVAQGLDDLGIILRSMSRPKEAEPLFRESLEIDQRLFPGDDRDSARAMDNVSMALADQGRAGEALTYARDGLAMRQRLFPGDHPDVAQSMGNVSIALVDLGRAEEALAPAREALAMRRRRFPGDHPIVARSMDNLSGVLSKLGRFVEAEPLLRDALAMEDRIVPGDHPRKAVYISDLASCLGKLGKQAEALDLAQKGADMAARTIPPKDHSIRRHCDGILAELKAAAATRPASQPVQ